MICLLIKRSFGIRSFFSRRLTCYSRTWRFIWSFNFLLLSILEAIFSTLRELMDICACRHRHCQCLHEHLLLIGSSPFPSFCIFQGIYCNFQVIPKILIDFYTLYLYCYMLLLQVKNSRFQFLCIFLRISYISLMLNLKSIDLSKCFRFFSILQLLKENLLNALFDRFILIFDIYQELCHIQTSRNIRFLSKRVFGPIFSNCSYPCHFYHYGGLNSFLK
jgi:hypothetical protein